MSEQNAADSSGVAKEFRGGHLREAGGPDHVCTSVPTPPKSDPAALPDLSDITLAPKPLNRGPFAVIYRGWDRVHRCDVIVKVQRATGDAVMAERFRREAAVMKRLRHPNIVALYHFHEGDPAALILEYVPGPTLADLVEANGWLAPLRAARIIEEIAAALDCAHAQGVIHRDVKPSNILLPPRGPARLYDFGVAHIDEDSSLTVMGDILGTIEYASPEQVHANEVPDARSDVYSLAAVAYFALTKTPPFRAADNSTQAQLSVMHRQVFADPPALRLYREELSPAVEAAVLRGLAKAPGARYPSAGQFAAALRAAVESGAGAPEQRAMAAASRRTGLMSAALAAVTLLLLGALALWRTGQITEPHSNRSSQVAETPKQTPTKVFIPTPVASTPIASTPIASTPIASTPIASKPIVVTKASKPKTVSALAPARKAKLTMRPQSLLVKATRRAKLRHAALVHPRPVQHLVAAVVPPAHHKLLKTPKPAHLAAQALRPKGVAGTTHVLTAPALHQVGWYTVSGWVPAGTPGPKSSLVRVSAQWVKVDGQPVLALALGRWAQLSAGKHVVTFQPTPSLGLGPKTWNIDLTSQAHLNQRIPFPATVATARTVPQPIGWLCVSGWLPVAQTDQKPQLVPVAAAWVKVDGWPSQDLAHGRWVSLPAGRHVLVFQPAPDSGADQATRTIFLSPQAHLNQHLPLTAAPLPAQPLHLRNP